MARITKQKILILLSLLLLLMSIKDMLYSNQNKQTKTTRTKNENLASGSNVQRKPLRNVLFLISDDMRVQLGTYQDQDYIFKSPMIMKTPNLDKLASHSLLMNNAHVQYGLCGPSRASILTGRRPDVTKIFDNFHYWRDSGGNFTTIPQYFKENGYFTIGVGKVFHKREASKNDDPPSWMELPPHVMNNDKHLMTGPERWKAITRYDNRLHPITDYLLVNVTKTLLRKLAPKAKNGQQPFFVAHGFKRPHAPYGCPKEFFDKYPMEDPGEYLTPSESKNCVVGDEKLRKYRQAYYACTSFVDSLVGELVNELELLGLVNNTIIMFISDHGYNFGEHGTFGKSYLYDTITRVPLILHIPDRTSRGIRSNAIVETLDVFQTLVEASGLQAIPTCPSNSSNIQLCTNGKSFMSLIDSPDQIDKREAFTQRRLNREGTLISYSIRTQRYRFSKAVKLQVDNSGRVKSWLDGTDSELFDHKLNHFELVNVVDDENYTALKESMNDRLERYIAKVSKST